MVSRKTFSQIIDALTGAEVSPDKAIVVANQICDLIEGEQISTPIQTNQPIARMSGDTSPLESNVEGKPKNPPQAYRFQSDTLSKTR